MRWVLALVAAFGVAASAEQPAAAPPLTAAEGRALADALAAIVDHAGAAGAEPRTTTLTERGINAYLRFQGAGRLPAAVGGAEMRLLGGGRLSARALVDLDHLRTERQRGLLDPLRYLGGQVEVVAVGALRAAGRVGQFELESLHVESIPLPVALLVEVVRAHRDSDGFDLREPFRLPYGITELSVEPERAVVFQ